MTPRISAVITGLMMSRTTNTQDAGSGGTQAAGAAVVDVGHLAGVFL